LGLLKMSDKLLQGEKFSTAVGKGLATGATAYAAGQIGQALKGKPEVDVPTDEVPTGYNARPDDYAAGSVDDKFAKGMAGARAKIDAANAKLGIDGSAANYNAAGTVAQGGARAVRDAVAKGALDSAEEYIKAGSITDYNSIGDAVGEIMSNYEGTAKISAQSLQSIEQMVRTKLMASMVDGNGIIQGGKAVAKGVAKAAVGDSIINTGKKLSEGQTYLIFSKVCALNDSMLAEGRLIEGPMDFIKGAAAKGMDKLKTVGKNLTTKVTADKLNSAWQKAGNPTDSDELAQFLEKQGINPDIVKKTFVGMKLPAPGAGAEAAKQKTDFENVKKMIMALPTDRKVRLLKFLTKQSATPQPQV
jgi:hypothetical protein